MESPVDLEQLDHLDQLERLDPRGLLENLATQELKVYLVYKDNLGLLDHQVHQDLLVKL